MLAKCCCNKDDRDRGLSSERGTHFDLVDLTEKFNQVINHVRRHQSVPSSLSSPKLVASCKCIANVLAHNAAWAGRTQFIAACKSRGGEEEGDGVELRELAESKQCHQG